MMDEPSVLDYLKARLTPWRGPAPKIPSAETSRPEVVRTVDGSPAVPLQQETAGHLPYPAEGVEPEGRAIARPAARVISWPWLSLVSAGLALVAQSSLEPGPERSWLPGAILYALSAGCLVVAMWRGEWLSAPLPDGKARFDPLTVRTYGLIAGIILGLIAFLAFGGNKFTRMNMLLWLLSMAAIIWAFWLPERSLRSWMESLWGFFSQREWKFSLTRSSLVAMAAIALVIFFRLYRLNQVPPEMFSDHAEKLLDVWDVLHGGTYIFFTRNTGREALQMYMTAAIIQLFGTGYSYLSLKIGTALAGLLTLPFMYLLGKEAGSRRIGLLAVVFAGIAYWPNVISRVGLRFPLYPLFVAPALYFLLRGIRTSNRNEFILSGIFLGIGLHGYTPIRILPVVIVVAVGIFVLHQQSRGLKKQTWLSLAVLALIALFVFLPLLRFSQENPEAVASRTISRLGSVERPLPGPASEIFLTNLWNAMTMFAWDDGEIWVHSVTHRPALDVVSGAFFYLGMAYLVVRYVRQRHWLDLFLVLSVPLLMMPSILSLAFPAENPALNRMAGAIVPVFLIVAIALDGLLNAVQTRLGPKSGARIAGGLVVILVTISSLQNYGLVFDKYQSVFELSSWNTSELGRVIHDFSLSVGTSDSAWVVAYPHWVDTRLVGINAGYPLKDFAIWPDQLAGTSSDPRAKLFLVKPEDSDGLQVLQTIYPQGVVQRFESRVENHDFLMYFVPPGKE